VPSQRTAYTVYCITGDRILYTARLSSFPIVLYIYKYIYIYTARLSSPPVVLYSVRAEEDKTVVLKTVVNYTVTVFSSSAPLSPRSSAVLHYKHTPQKMRPGMIPKMNFDLNWKVTPRLFI